MPRPRLLFSALTRRVSRTNKKMGRLSLEGELMNRRWSMYSGYSSSSWYVLQLVLLGKLACQLVQHVFQGTRGLRGLKLQGTTGGCWTLTGHRRRTGRAGRKLVQRQFTVLTCPNAKLRQLR